MELCSDEMASGSLSRVFWATDAKEGDSFAAGIGHFEISEDRAI
jgi:hypothetical protein